MKIGEIWENKKAHTFCIITGFKNDMVWFQFIDKNGVKESDDSDFINYPGVELKIFLKNWRKVYD